MSEMLRGSLGFKGQKGDTGEIGTPIPFNGTFEQLKNSNESKFYNYIIVDNADTEFAGHWVYYDRKESQWKDGGVYQATSFPEVDDIRNAYDGTNYDTAGDSVRAQAKKIHKMIIDSISKQEYQFNVPTVVGTQLAKDFDFLAVKGETLKFDFNFNGLFAENKINAIFYNENNEQIDQFVYNGITSIFTLKNGNATKIRFYCSSSNVIGTGEIIVNITLNVKPIIETNHDINFKNVIKALFDYNLSLTENLVQATTYSKKTPVFIPKNTKVKFLFTSDVVNESSNMALGFTYESGYVNNVATITLNKEQEVLIPEDVLAVTCYISGTNIINDGTFSLDISVFEDGIVQKLQEIDRIITNKSNNLTVGILGDSLSTYKGWIPEGYNPWYTDEGNNTPENNVSSVKQTWWYQLLEELKATLLINSSWSGTTICNTGYNGADASQHSFITRMKNDLGEKKVLQVKPNIIFIMGGTNDNWGKSPVGELKYSDWTEGDLKNTLPAFCYMLDYLKLWNPGCKLVNIVYQSVSDEVKTGMVTACDYYGVDNIVLDEVSVTGGHPNQEGMTEIKNQVINFLATM